MIAELRAMDVANASMYEAATATAEAAVMAVVHTERHRIVVAGTTHPDYLAVLRTYGAGRDFEVVELPADGGLIDPDRAAAALEGAAALIIQQPNFYGALEDAAALCEAAHRGGALAVAACDPIALALIEAPGEFGADIAVGECQQLGIPLWYGGPYCGYLAAANQLLRKIPGRLVGETVDERRQRGVFLPLQAREQPIRRGAAASHSCPTQALIALGATAYMGVMGAAGLTRVAEISVQRAHHLAGELGRVPGYSVAFDAPFLWEFALRCPGPAAETLAKLRARDILGGLDLASRGLPDCILVAVTEMNSPRSLAKYVEALS